MRRDEATAVCERTTHFEGAERELPETVRGALDNALSNPAMKRHLGLSSGREIRDRADFQRLHALFEPKPRSHKVWWLGDVPEP